MQFDASFGWQQGTVYRSAAIHYILVLQVVLGLPIIILVVYASGNMGWWTNKEAAVSWAICESAATMLLAIPVQVVIGYVRPNQNDLARRMTATLGMSFAVLWLLLSGSAGVIMLQKPGKDYRKAFDEPPYWTWWTATGLVYLQFIISGWRAFKLLRYIFKPAVTEQTAAGEIPLSDTVPRTRASSTSTLRSTEGASNQGLPKFRLNPFLTESERVEEQAHAEEETVFSVTSRRMSATARGKQAERHYDGVDELDRSLTFVEPNGAAWSPI